MSTMTITIERTPGASDFEGKQIEVEELQFELLFARKTSTHQCRCVRIRIERRHLNQ
jgi:hypothetical protein